MKNNNYLIVTLITILGTLSAAILGSGVKYLSSDLNTYMISFYRCLFGLILILPFLPKNNFSILRTKNIKLQFLRSFVNVISMLCWFGAIGMMHFEKATALGFTTPLFTTILAVIILGEIIRLHRITALTIGFIGIIIIIRPGYIPFEIGTSLMLLASVSFSFVLIMVKKLSETDKSLTIIFYHLLFMTPLTFLLALFFWQPISIKHILLFIIMGSAGLVTHWCMAKSLKLSDTTFVMPLQFTKLIWASASGYFFFAEIPDFWTWVGSIIIFISVVYITYREAFVKKHIPSTKNINKILIE